MCLCLLQVLAGLHSLWPRGPDFFPLLHKISCPFPFGDEWRVEGSFGLSCHSFPTKVWYVRNEDPYQQPLLGRKPLGAMHNPDDCECKNHWSIQLEEHWRSMWSQQDSSCALELELDTLLVTSVVQEWRLLSAMNLVHTLGSLNRETRIQKSDVVSWKIYPLEKSNGHLGKQGGKGTLESGSIISGLKCSQSPKLGLCSTFPKKPLTWREWV